MISFIDKYDAIERETNTDATFTSKLQAIQFDLLLF